jgi:hypothetical protein
MSNPQTIYICGDSFSSVDSDYGNNWPEMLADKLPQIQVVNLSMPSASNYLIYLQVKHALNNNCDYLIYNATGSTRQEFVLKVNNTKIDSIDRYHNVSHSDIDKELLCTSWVNPFDPRVHKNIFKSEYIDEIKKFCMQYIDMPSTIEKNYIFIQQTLSMIASNRNIKAWAWSRGGFEHKKFNPIREWEFESYISHESNINLWDYYDPDVRRPYYHITNKELLQTVCDQYLDMLQI